MNHIPYNIKCNTLGDAKEQIESLGLEILNIRKISKYFKDLTTPINTILVITRRYSYIVYVRHNIKVRYGLTDNELERLLQFANQILYNMDQFDDVLELIPYRLKKEIRTFKTKMKNEYNRRNNACDIRKGTTNVKRSKN
jgi:hypothetical protein